MANILEKITAIRQAIFGKDVREGIASGIDLINKEVESTTEKQELLEVEFDQLVINAGNSNAEIVQARVAANGTAYESIKKRMDNSDSLMAEKAKQSDLSVQQARIDTLVAHSGDVSSNGELLDIRVDSNGYTFATGGENVRNISASISGLRKFSGANSKIEMDTTASASNTIQFNNFNDRYFKATVNHVVDPSYSYVRLQLAESKATLLANKPKLILNLQSDTITDVGVLLTDKTNWATSPCWVKTVKLRSDTITSIVIDFSEQSVIDFFTTSTSTAVYILIPIDGHTTPRYPLGAYDISGYMVSASTKTSPKSISEVALLSQKSLESDHSKLTDLATIATNSKYSGVKAINFDTDVLLSAHPGITKTIVGGKVKIQKVVTTGSSTWFGLLIKITYEKLEDLNCDFKLNYEQISGVVPNSFVIVKGYTDWNPTNHPISLLSYLTNPTINLYNSIVNSAEYSYYNGVKELWINLSYFNSTTSIVDTTLAEWNIRPFLVDKTAYVVANELLGFNKSDYARKDEVSGIVNTGAENYMTDWGDSLTAMGGWTTRFATLTGLTLYNGGTGGETVRTIMARQGGDVMMVNNITIPATTTPVTIATMSGDLGINTFMGYKATPLLQGGSSHVNPCYIGDIQGTLTWTGSAYNDTTGTWTFTRTTAGTQTTINRPTAIRTAYDINRNSPKLMVIFMGQNGGYTDTADLIQCHKLMIDHANAKEHIILGLSSGTASERASYEQAMKKEFGRRFISLREYLSVYGLADAGITPTQADLDAMALGKTPPSLLIDSVHFTDTCRTIIGDMLYRKVKELNIL